MPQVFSDRLFEPTGSSSNAPSTIPVDNRLTDSRIEPLMTNSFDDEMIQLQKSLEASEARLLHFTNLVDEKSEKFQRRRQKPIGKKQ